jgi:nucleoside-diphosphate-sugar epimerase
MQTIAITGASGFIGKHLVEELLRTGDFLVRVLSRDKPRDVREGRFGAGVEIIEGDLSKPDTLVSFLKPGCIVINLVYLWDGGEGLNLRCTRNLLAACNEAKVARLVHCSTAAVAGRAPNDLIDEGTQCLPITEYGTTKLKIERVIIDTAKGNFESVILRPTSVFGIAGAPLARLAADISGGSRFKNYLKSCLFGRRRMNLVHISNVVAAIVFLIRHTGRLDGETFIISDDDDPKNNFIDVESLLMDGLGVDEYRLPRLQIPLAFLKLILMSLGRNNVNPFCNFTQGKLGRFGFKSEVSLSQGIQEYASWYRDAHLVKRTQKIS